MHGTLVPYSKLWPDSCTFELGTKISIIVYVGKQNQGERLLGRPGAPIVSPAPSQLVTLYHLNLHEVTSLMVSIWHHRDFLCTFMQVLCVFMLSCWGNMSTNYVIGLGPFSLLVLSFVCQFEFRV